MQERRTMMGKRERSSKASRGNLIGEQFYKLGRHGSNACITKGLIFSPYM
jgi:hypothetical protein